MSLHHARNYREDTRHTEHKYEVRLRSTGKKSPQIAFALLLVLDLLQTKSGHPQEETRSASVSCSRGYCRRASGMRDLHCVRSLREAFEIGQGSIPI